MPHPLSARSLLTRSFVGLGFAALAACNTQKPEPLTASSASQATYAEHYPDNLAASRQKFVDGETDARTVIEGMSTYPDQLKNPDHNGVLTVVTKADEDGKSDAYAHRYAEAEVVARFHAEEKEKLNQQVAGSVRYVLKDKGAGSDVVDAGGSAAVRGMEKAVTKQLEERVREASEAHRFIEDNQETLGKQNVEKLKKQADDIARASYIVHVAVIEQQRKLEDQVAEASEVKKTLEATIETEFAIAADPTSSPSRKAIAEKRASAAEAARGKLDAEVEQSEAALKELQKRNEQLAADYEKALDALKDKLEELAKAQPAPKKS